MEATPASWCQHIIVCGLRQVALRVVEQLRFAGDDVVVLDDNPDPRLVANATELGAHHVARSSRRASGLTAAGIETAAALICAADAELENLETALLARRLRPDLRIVVQLGNLEVGRAVAAVTGTNSVLDVARLAAPTLADACLNPDERTIELDGEQFVLRELVVERAGTLRELYGVLAPVAVVPADGGELDVCPGRDRTVHPGDRVTMIGTPADFAEREPARGLELRRYVPAMRRRGTLSQALRYARGFIGEIDRPMRVTLGVLLGVALLSMVLLRVGYEGADGTRMSLLDSGYFTVETLTTVGYGDFYFGHQSGWLQVWGIALMVLGATLVTIIYAMLTNLLVSRRIEQSLGRQVATRMRDHVVLIGLGAVGLRVLEHLVDVGTPVVVLDHDLDNRFLARARALDVPVVFGDSTQPASLDAVGLERARAVAVLTSNDLVNIETALVVNDRLGDRRDEVPLVLRVFDRELAHTIESSFGLRYVRSTTALAAPWFVGAALGLDIQTTFWVDRLPLLIGRLVVAEAGGLRGKTMSELSARIRVLAINRRDSPGVLEYPPRRDTKFEGGDRAYLIGPYEDLLKVLRRDAAGSVTPP